MSTPADRAFAEAAAQGLPKYVEDPRVLDRIAAIFIAAELARKNAQTGDPPTPDDPPVRFPQ